MLRSRISSMQRKPLNPLNTRRINNTALPPRRSRRNRPQLRAQTVHQPGDINPHQHIPLGVVLVDEFASAVVLADRAGHVGCAVQSAEVRDCAGDPVLYGACVADV